MKTNIYQKLHKACCEAGGVKKADKVQGMKFNPYYMTAFKRLLWKLYCLMVCTQYALTRTK